MKSARHLALLGLLLACGVVSAAAAQTAAPAGTVRGRVVAIADGDTLTLLDADRRQHKIRLQGIDAPERAQAYGTRSGQQLSDFVFGKDVEVRIDKLDRYRRAISTVMFDEQDINLEMVRAGLAWHYKQYQNEQSAQDQKLYAAAEDEARSARRGLWADARPTPPWEFRRGGRAEGARRSGRGEAHTALASPRDSVPPRSDMRVAPSTLTVDAPSSGVTTQSSIAPGAITGNRRSRIYHEPGCPNYADVAPQNRVPFNSRAEAERAGYRRARNCPPQ